MTLRNFQHWHVLPRGLARLPHVAATGDSKAAKKKPSHIRGLMFPVSVLERWYVATITSCGGLGQVVSEITRLSPSNGFIWPVRQRNHQLVQCTYTHAGIAWYAHASQRPWRAREGYQKPCQNSTISFQAVSAKNTRHEHPSGYYVQCFVASTFVFGQLSRTVPPVRLQRAKNSRSRIERINDRQSLSSSL